MKASFFRLIVPALMIAAVTACSSSTGPSGNSTFTAVIDGVNWSSSAAGITVTGTGSVVPGSVTISGTQISGGNTTSIALSLGFITGNGTFPLGVNQLSTAGGTALVQTTSAATVGSWSTGFSGAAGTITITGITGTTISGTFQFTAPPQIGSGGASKVVTNGKFTVPLNSFTVAPASNPGSLIKATLAGAAFNAATITGQGSGGSFSMLGTTTSSSGVTTSVSLAVSGTVVAGGVYPLVPPPGGGTYINLNATVGNSSFGGSGAGDSGSVTITTLSGGRAKGSFSGSLVGGGSAMAVTGGTFDVKIQ